MHAQVAPERVGLKQAVQMLGLVGSQMAQMGLQFLQILPTEEAGQVAEQGK
jgi:hypothetical protein